MDKLVVILHKPAVEPQLAAMIDYVNPKEIFIFIQNDGRLDFGTVKKWECISTFSGSVQYDYINFIGLTFKKMRDKLNKLRPFTHIALPLFVGIPFWGNVQWLMRFSCVINVSDGTCENTTILDSFLRLKTKIWNPFRFIKAIFMPPIIHMIGKAVICFHPYYPLYNSCYAKRSFRVNDISISSKKSKYIGEIIDSYASKYLIIGGYEYPSQVIADMIGISDYIATCKSKEIVINNKTIPIKEYICTEELIKIFKPKAVIGYTSDAVAAVSFLYPKVPCYAIWSKEVQRKWGSLHNWIYKKQTKKIGINVLNENDICNIKL